METTDPSVNENVVHINAAGSKRNHRSKEASKDSDKIALAEAYMVMADIINHKSNTGLLDKDLEHFPIKFHVTKLTEGVRIILREYNNGLVKQVPGAELDSAIVSYTVGPLRQRSGFKWAMKNCREARDMWFHETKPVPIPLMVKWQEEEGLAYSVLPWKLNPEARLEDAPLFAEMFSRMTNAQAAQLWIGSLFDMESYLHEYLWLYGDGNNGKSALVRFLVKVFKNAACALEVQKNYVHASTREIGKRLGCYNDIDDEKHILSGAFKRASGGDLKDICPKGKDGYSIEPTTKYIFTSNFMPSIGSKEADVRRLIFCEMQIIPTNVSDEDRATYEKRLWEEGGTFLSYCIQLYKKMVPNKGKVPVDHQVMQDLISHNEEEYASLAEKYFEFHTSYYCEPSNVRNLLKSQEKMNRTEITEFMDYLTRIELVSFDNHTNSNTKVRRKRWIGVRIKPTLSRFGVDFEWVNN